MENKNEKIPRNPNGNIRAEQNQIPEENNRLEEDGFLGVDPVTNIYGVNDPAVVPEVPDEVAEVSDEVVKEKNDRPAANTIKWAIIIAIILMIIIYFIMFYDRDVVSSAP